MPDWTRAGPPPDPELDAAVDRLLGELRFRYSTGALTVADVGRAHSALVAGSLLDSESYRRAWLVATLEERHTRQLRTTLQRFVDAGVLVRGPTDDELTGWLARREWGAYRVAAELAVACGWEGAADVEVERSRFKAAWARERERFEVDDVTEPGDLTE